MTDKPTRRDLLKPVQLLGLAFVAAVFAGVVTLVTMGFFQRPADPDIAARVVQSALVTAGVVAGVTFIVVLVVVALLLLAVDPAQIAKPVDRPVLLPDETPTDAEGSGPAPDATPRDGDSPRPGGAPAS